MMMMAVMMAVMMFVMVGVTVSAALGLEGGLDLSEIRSEATKHIFDDVVGPNPKNVVSNFSRQMSITQVPGKAHQLYRIFSCDFYKILGSSLDLYPPPVFQLQSISISHRNRLRKIEENIVALVCGQAKAAAMARVKVESKRACRLFLRPLPRRYMNRSTMHRHIST
jgi:hypothetical protein